MVLCTNCKKPNYDTRFSTCPECRRKRRELYQYRRENGLCIRCGQKAENGKACCLLHAMDRRTDSANYRRRHPDYYKKSKKVYGHELREQRAADGMCTACGKRKADPGYRTCVYCRKKKEKQNRDRYRTKLIHPYLNRNEWPEYGYCYNCGKEPPMYGKKICEKCWEKNKKSLKKARQLGDVSYFRGLNKLVFRKEGEGA